MAMLWLHDHLVAAGVVGEVGVEWRFVGCIGWHVL
jgi:hypothetical protein